MLTQSDIDHFLALAREHLARCERCHQPEAECECKDNEQESEK